MSQQHIASLYNISNRFLRSINLQRDFNDPNALSSYVLTGHALECLNRISEGTKDNSSQRAWRITGDYGSGKSNFALFLAQWLNGNEAKLPSSVRSLLNNEGINNNKKYFPLLITGVREQMGKIILKNLSSALFDNFGKVAVQKRVEDILNSDGISDSDVIECIIDANSYISKHGHDGLILIIDELGKFLEYAALYPEEQDIYLMQNLAEVASGSNNASLFVIGILHQGFSAYADTLSQVAQHEWEKVAGRYDEILFNQPLEQLAYLINSALGLDTGSLNNDIKDYYNERMKFYVSEGWYGYSAGVESLSSMSSQIYPLHPCIFPVVVDAFRRFGQNERSLFSFMLSNEPYGLQEFSNRENLNSIYCLHNLYDYIKVNFGHKLHNQSYRSHWHVIDSLIDSFLGENELEIQILKTIGIINLLDSNKFLATNETIVKALDGASGYSVAQIEQALDKLSRKQRVIYYRGVNGGYCLWPHTSVNLEAAYQKAQDEIGNIKSVSDYIKSYVNPRPIVARRHYIQTGNLRYFDLIYCSADEVEKVIANVRNSPEGSIIIPLCETAEQQKNCLELAKSKFVSEVDDLIIAVPKPLNALSSLVKEVRCWQHVEQNTLELNSDFYACEEVKRQQKNALNNLEHRLENFIDVKNFSDKKNLQWYKKGHKLVVNNGRDLLSKLSDCFDDTYNMSPIIKNELVNRKNISSAAAGARMRLISQILESPCEYRLGMVEDKTPPEVAIYLSLLYKGGIHTKNEDEWKLGLPMENADECRLIPSFKLIDELLRNHGDSKVSVDNIFLKLSERPYGVRDGIAPIILVIYYKIYENDIAVYEEGSFLKNIRQQEFLRLTKAPEKFEFQLCSIEGVRASLFSDMLKTFNITGKKQPHLLDVVRPLCIFIAQLPEYVIKTKRLSENTILVRNAILDAKEPVKLIFNDLPLACGLKAISTEASDENECNDYVNRLKDALDELKFCYIQLRERIKKLLMTSFEFSGDFTEFRKQLEDRAQCVAMNVVEPQLKAFALRLFDDSLEENEWTESIGAFVSSKTPERWKDMDEDKFFHSLPILVDRFKNVESIVFDPSEHMNSSNNGCKVSITKSTGEELSKVLYYSEEDMDSLNKLQNLMSELIANNPKLGVIAASREIWKNLSK